MRYCVTIEDDVDIDDDDIVEYVLGDPDLVAQVLDGKRSSDPENWAAVFYEYDTVDRLQAIEALKHVIPGIKIELP